MAMARPVVPEDSALIAKLHEISAARPKLIKSSVYSAPADPDIQVRSWKMDEFKYYDVPSPFPTLARGIFTVELPKAAETDKQEYRIVARGYDKFFNIGEVPWTTWDALEAHTAAPYTLSLKSNGCIIFIAALTPTKLVITSKHSIGPTPGEGMSHAQAGEAWLRKYFEQKGKSEAELATRLWENNWTAIAELCDDSFEEHVLGYPPDKTGLHLHGLNESTKAFHTLPQADVDAFAAEWGFIRTASVVLPTLDEVRSFTTACGETGSWNGEPVEGFVAPYAPGATFFFKVKFDEPYMMYRDWREVTKSLIRLHEQGPAGKNRGPGMSENSVHKGKMRRAETRAYVRWVIGEIRRDPTEFEEFGKGRGIIATRERFLEYLKTEEGKALLAAAKAGYMPPPPAAPGAAPDVPFGKTIIVPVAIPGISTGKTAVSVALAHIFGFGHTQSDDVRSKKPAPIFIKNVTNLLKTHDVVIADKSLAPPSVSSRSTGRWRASPPPTCTASAPRVSHSAGRIISRSAPDASSAEEHERVIWMFVNKTEPLSPVEVDAVVDMVIGEDEGLEAQVRRAVSGVSDVLGLEEPEEEKIMEGVEKAKGYAVAGAGADGADGSGSEAQSKGKGKGKGKQAQGKKAGETAEDKDQKQKKKGKPPRYFGLLPDVDLDTLLAGPIAQEPSAMALFEHLRKEKRVATRPHVTIVHSKALEGSGAEVGAKELWERCATLDSWDGKEEGKTGEKAVFECTLGSVVWDDRVMAVTVDEVRLEKEAGAGQAGAEFVSKLPEEVRKRLHITVGTRNPSIAPVEAKTLVEKWKAGKSGGDIKSLSLGEVTVKARVRGLFN
ncbi:tRNA ligase [Mycena venus]|uniref:tRNA ligase n=1 Tax=Mycena venus TaxID=2733690 RepID=A0A8H7CKK9_9AGAR|nr:tRNA ligase [Mycena venus]